MKLSFAFLLFTLALPRGALGLKKCAFTECSEQSNCDDLSVDGTQLKCVCGATQGGLEIRRELGQTGSRRNKTRKKTANRGSVRALKAAKKCGKRDGEPITGLCGPCPDARIACTECTEPGEMCCDFNSCQGSQRTCNCDDVSELFPSCGSCNFGPLYSNAGMTCCSDEAVDFLECPSCTDQHALDCAKCNVFQTREGVPCCDEGTLTSCDTELERKRFRFLQDITQFDATPDQPHMIEHFLTDAESDPNAHFSQTQGILPPEDLSKAVAFVEEHFRKRESITEDDRKEYKLVVTAEMIIDLFGQEDVRRILDLLYEHVGTEDQPVTGIVFQRFEHDGTSISPYHTDGKAISLVILLNDDYDGGEMTYLTGDGPTVIESVAGSATVHGPGVVHGNAAVNGIKYQLTFLTFPNAQADCMFAGLLDTE